MSNNSVCIPIGGSARKEKEEGKVKCISLRVLDSVLQVARIPKFELPSANRARADAESACVGEERKGTRYPESVYIAQKLRCL